MAARLVFRPAARADLNKLYDWIAERAGAGSALAYVLHIREKAGRLAVYPGLGSPHDVLGPGVRSISYRRRTVILSRLGGDAVEIIRVLDGGRDLSRSMQGDD